MARYSSGASLRGQLLAGGYSFPFDISGVVDYAAAHDLGVDYVLGRVYSSTAFRQHFPGIFRADGTLRMSPAQYLSYQEQAINAASSAGFSLTRQQVGSLINSEVSADEFAFRVQAAATVRSNSYVLGSLNQILRSSGQKAITSAQEAFDFLTGKSNREVYKTYEAASILGAAKQAGLDTGTQAAKSIASHTAGVTSFEEANKAFQQLAADRALGKPELASFGLSLFDQEQIALGLGTAEQNRRYQQALKQRQSALQTDQAQQKVGLTPQGRPTTGTYQAPGL